MPPEKIIQCLILIKNQIHSDHFVLHDSFTGSAFSRILNDLFHKIDNPELFLNSLCIINYIIEESPNFVTDELLSFGIIDYLFQICNLITETGFPYYLHLLGSISMINSQTQIQVLVQFPFKFLTFLFFSFPFSSQKSKQQIWIQASFFISCITHDYDNLDYIQYPSFISWIIPFFISYSQLILNCDENDSVANDPTIIYFMMQSLNNLLLSDDSQELHIVNSIFDSPIPLSLSNLLQRFLSSQNDTIPFILGNIEILTSIQIILEPKVLLPLLTTPYNASISAAAYRVLIADLKISNDFSFFGNEEIQHYFLSLYNNSLFLIKVYIIRIFILLFDKSDSIQITSFIAHGLIKPIIEFILQVDDDDDILLILNCINHIIDLNMSSLISAFFSNEVLDSLSSLAQNDNILISQLSKSIIETID